ncbi:hypothetical protein TTHERM_00678430 (macronuclear) [Tetrahymena thermophila SB210]|uniref:Uncharacterized protein n=1 Tax=Tetrahymena thermophila (strain SB210) TaxID=312017 RepID=I7M4L3_TETTS|nr:hypothetical protein TTHERM_00678430 [Tetrahymena thermophila SB210]EAS07577.3 hypothetical protein TTHERM_00678430 [Tetrahymena thermophila SB210]|eukprot:XP_001027819.3 hypothetical protein TTHERM_00678430 [Tetrahymena thermophila SB210]
MKMFMEEEDICDDLSKTKSLKCINSSKNKSKVKQEDDEEYNSNNQILVAKDYEIAYRDDKSKFMYQLFLNKMQQKLSHVIIFDLLVDLDSGASIQEQQDEYFRGFDLLHNIKPVYKVEKKCGYVSFHMPEKEIPDIDINYSIQLLESQQSAKYKEFAEMLRQMNIKQAIFRDIITRILERNNYNMEYMMKIKQQRQEYMQNYSQEKFMTKQDSSQDLFVNIAGYSFCIINKSMHLSYLSKSKELIYLLGADEDQQARVALKKSQLDMFSYDSRAVIQQVYMNYILHGKTTQFEQNFNLLSYDNISIYCPAEFKVCQIKYPPELQYDPEIQCDDFIVVSQYDIQPFQVQKVLGIRKQFDELQRYMQTFDQDFEYSIQSENFLSKFYKKVLKKIHKRDKIHEMKEREIKSRTCGYRHLNQSK